jgi:hypothetical protein
MNRLLTRYVVVGLLVTSLSGCATQSFEVNGPVGPSQEAALETSQTFFVGGVGQSAQIDAAEVCGGAQNVARVETELSVIDGLLASLTGGIYSPRTARVYCL